MQTPTHRHPYLVAITVSKQKPFIIQYVDIPPQTGRIVAPYWGLTFHPNLQAWKNANPIFMKFDAEQ